jgi:arylsulfatase A-like enzyme/Flp pilus assembly protein TadD
LIRARALALLLALLAAIATGCSTDPRPRNVVLVTLDTVRADRLGSYGRAGADTPWLDALAARGMRVERAYAPVPITLPSHVTILTGLLPPRTGIRDNGDLSLATGVTTLAERLSAGGFFTAAAVGGFPVASRFPVSRGFARFDDRFADPRNPAGLERDAGEVVRAALGAASGRGARPLFLWVHLFDAHDPYEPAEPWRSRHANDPYQGEIARVDAALADLEAGLRPIVGAEPVLWVVVADHGEGLGEHGEDTHGFFLYEPTVRVPFLMAGPGVPRGTTVPGPRGIVDVVPTILDRLGLEIPAGLDGEPLRDGPTERSLYVETLLPLRHYGWSPLRAAVSGRTKYIAAPRPELYDVVDDPRESQNRIHESTDDASTLAAWIDAIDRSTGGAPATTPDPRLASLGYVASGARAEAGSALADPKDRLATYRDFQRAAKLLEQGRGNEALAVVDRLLATEDAPGVRLQRARALRMTGRLAESAEELGRLGAFPGAALERARIAAAVGDGGTALREADRHLAEAPGDAEALMFRGAARELLGDPAGAEADYRAALDANPAYAAASLRLVRIVALAGRLDEARSLLRAHLERHPGDTFARNLLAEL